MAFLSRPPCIFKALPCLYELREYVPLSSCRDSRARPSPPPTHTNASHSSMFTHDLWLSTTTTPRIRVGEVRRFKGSMSAAAAVCAAADASALPATPVSSAVYTKALAAVERNDTKTLKDIWEQHGSTIFTQTLPGERGHLLHFAAKKLRAKAVVWLIEHGANVNAIDQEGEVSAVTMVAYAPSTFSSRSPPFLPQPNSDPSLLVRHHRLLLRPH